MNPRLVTRSWSMNVVPDRSASVHSRSMGWSPDEGSGVPTASVVGVSTAACCVVVGPLASVGALPVVQAVAVRIRLINSGAVWLMRLMNPISLDIGGSLMGSICRGKP